MFSIGGVSGPCVEDLIGCWGRLFEEPRDVGVVVAGHIAAQAGEGFIDEDVHHASSCLSALDWLCFRVVL